MTGKNILVIEDNPVDIRLITQTFSESGEGNYVEVIGDGQEAISFLKKEGKFLDEKTPDFVILDLKLPKKSGNEILSEIRVTPGLETLPVFVMTNSDYRGDVEKVMAFKVVKFITKPLKLQDFKLEIIGIIKTIENMQTGCQ
jgi:CheY-like chemotaxis protein